MNENTNINNVAENAAEQTTALTLCKDMSDEFQIQEAGSGAALRFTTTTDDVKLFNAINGTGLKVADFIGQTVNVTDIIVSNATVNVDMNDESEDAEKCDKPCVHFILDTGDQISSISNGIIRAAKNLLAVGFIPTPENPFTIRFKEIKTKRGTAHTFDLVSK